MQIDQVSYDKVIFQIASYAFPHDPTNNVFVDFPNFFHTAKQF